jgi:hypothetical protein
MKFTDATKPDRKSEEAEGPAVLSPHLRSVLKDLRISFSAPLTHPSQHFFRAERQAAGD